MGVSPEAERSERRAGRRSSQQRTRIVAAVLLLLLGVALVWWLTSRSSDGPADGPLLGVSDASVAGPATPGAPVAAGALQLRNEGSDDLIIDRVVLVDPTTGMRLVGMYAVPADEGAAGIGGGFRWPRGASEVEGLTIAPSAKPAFRLVLGAQIDAQGVYRSPGIRITYHVGDHGYVKAFAVGLTLCAPPRLYRSRCA